MIATTRGALLRGATTTDPLGDEVDDNLEALPGRNGNFALSLIEKSKNVQDPETGTWRAVTYFEGMTRARITPLPGDRLKDLRTGAIYAISDTSSVPRSLAGFSSTTLDLRQVSA